jgi:hypothetical protein
MIAPMQPAPQPDEVEVVDAVPVLAVDSHALARRPAAGAAVAKQAAAVAATSFAAGIATVAAVRAGRAVRTRRRERQARHVVQVVATRSFLVDVHLVAPRRD